MTAGHDPRRRSRARAAVATAGRRTRRGTSTSSPRRSPRRRRTRSRRTARRRATSSAGRGRGRRRRAGRGHAVAPASLRRPPHHPAVRQAHASPARWRRCAATSAGCAATGVIAVDPSASLRAPAGEGRLPRVLDAGEIWRSCSTAPAPDDEPVWRRRRDDAVLELLYGSGVRVSELCRLDRRRARPRRGAVTVWGKGVQGTPGPAQRCRRSKRCARGSRCAREVVPPAAVPRCSATSAGTG